MKAGGRPDLAWTLDRRRAYATAAAAAAALSEAPARPCGDRGLNFICEEPPCKSPACSMARDCSQFVGFPTTEVLGPAASEEEIKALIDRHGLIFIKPVFKGGIGKKGKAGLLGPRHRPEDRAGREGAALLRRAPGRQRDGQGERRDLRGRRAGRARGLLLDHRLDALPRADDDAHAHGRHGHRGARQEPGRASCRSIR